MASVSMPSLAKSRAPTLPFIARHCTAQAPAAQESVAAARRTAHAVTHSRNAVGERKNSLTGSKAIRARADVTRSETPPASPALNVEAFSTHNHNNGLLPRLQPGAAGPPVRRGVLSRTVNLDRRGPRDPRRHRTTLVVRIVLRGEGQAGHQGRLRGRRSAARENRKHVSISAVYGCEPPNTRRPIRSVSSSVVTASRTSSRVAPASL